MSPIFLNGKNTPLNANTGGVPDVGDALLEWFQPMTFGVVTKTTQNFQVVETVVETSFRGVIQPLSGRSLAMKPEGQRQWKWIQVHSDPCLILKTDQIIVYLGTQYRVMSQQDFRLYGYVRYELANDYTGSGPTVVTP